MIAMGLASLLKRPFKKVECDISGHLIDPKAEDSLFDDDRESVDTICKRCGTPLILQMQEDDTYIVRERLYPD